MSDSFSPAAGLVLVTATVFGPRGSRAVRLALDTGATETAISRRVLVLVGVNTVTAPTVTVVMGGVVPAPLVIMNWKRWGNSIPISPSWLTRCPRRCRLTASWAWTLSAVIGWSWIFAPARSA